MSKAEDMLRRLGAREHGDPMGEVSPVELGRALIWVQEAADGCPGPDQEGEVAARVLFLAVQELLERRR